ncbi:MAG TPA: hypothetical protein GXX56_00015, partial [Rhodocyclaceae bacterium]|nr:hypothetical protein [Rhodocyclaceae bacterium]
MNLAAHTLVYSAARCSLIPAPESARRQGKHKRKRRNRLAGATATLFASRDATIVGSSVLADRDLDVIAGRDVNLLAAENRFTEDYRFKSS